MFVLKYWGVGYEVGRVMGHELWAMGMRYGSWVLHYGLWVMGHGSCIMGYGSHVVDDKACSPSRSHSLSFSALNTLHFITYPNRAISRHML